MRRLAVVLSVLSLLLLALPAVAGPLPAAGYNVWLGTHYAGKLRDFHFYVAPNVPAVEPVPLLIALHGLYLDPLSTEAATGFDHVADTEDVAVVYPYGLNGSWNAGTCCGRSSAAQVDDVGFLVQIVQIISALRPIDLHRVYISGFSNGGMMALRALCDRPDVFAAAVSVAGTLQAPCAAGQPVNAMLIHGTADGVVPFNGMRYSKFLGTRLTAVPATAATLAKRSHCTSSTVSRTTALYSVRTFQGCAVGGAVKVLAADGMGHRWPTPDKDRIDGGQLAWSFLSAHRRR
jgi:polyhydroxybutyrate depolymerase